MARQGGGDMDLDHRRGDDRPVGADNLDEMTVLMDDRSRGPEHHALYRQPGQFAGGIDRRLLGHELVATDWLANHAL